MKIALFMFIAAFIGGGLAWFYWQPKEVKQLILNRKSYLTFIIITVTMVLLFVAAATGSLFSLKVF